MLYTVTVSDKGQITIPAKIRDALDIEYGQDLLLMKTGQSIGIHPLPKKNKKQSIMHLFGSIKPPKGVSSDPEKAIEEMIKIRYGKDYFS